MSKSGPKIGDFWTSAKEWLFWDVEGCEGVELTISVNLKEKNVLVARIFWQRVQDVSISVSWPLHKMMTQPSERFTLSNVIQVACST